MTTTNIPAALLEADEVARIIGMSKRTLWRLVGAGRYPAPVRFNRKLVRFPASALQLWLADNGAPVPSEAPPVTLALAKRERAPALPRPPKAAPADSPLPADLVTAKIAGRVAGVSASAIYRWSRQGKLPHWRRGGRLFVRQADVLGMFVSSDVQALAVPADH